MSGITDGAVAAGGRSCSPSASSPLEDGGQWGGQRLAVRRQYLPTRGPQRHHAAGGEIQVASLAALAGDQQLVDAGKPLALLDLVDLRIHSRKELLPWQKGLDVESTEEVPGRAAGHLSRESTQHAPQRIDEQRQAEALVWRVRVPSGAINPPLRNSPESVVGRPA